MDIQNKRDAFRLIRYLSEGSHTFQNLSSKGEGLMREVAFDYSYHVASTLGNIRIRPVKALTGERGGLIITVEAHEWLEFNTGAQTVLDSVRDAAGRLEASGHVELEGNEAFVQAVRVAAFKIGGLSVSKTENGCLLTSKGQRTTKRRELEAIVWKVGETGQPQSYRCDPSDVLNERNQISAASKATRVSVTTSYDRTTGTLTITPKKAVSARQMVDEFVKRLNAAGVDVLEAARLLSERA